MHKPELMDYYNPEEVMSYSLNHTVLYTFQFETAFAQIVTTMGGNCSGAEVMHTDFEMGITVPVTHELTEKHVIFYDEEDSKKPYREVGSLIFHYPDGKSITIDITECGELLVGIQILSYEK